MLSIVAICSLLAVVTVLYACSAQVADGEELHDLTIRVHTLRNEYLATLKGPVIEVEEAKIPDVPKIDTSAFPEPDAQPEPAAQAA